MSHPDFALKNNLQLERKGPSAGLSVESWLLKQIFGAIGPAPLRFVFKGGAEIHPARVPPIATVTIADRRTLAQMIVDPEVAFGEGVRRGPDPGGRGSRGRL